MVCAGAWTLESRIRSSPRTLRSHLLEGQRLEEVEACVLDQLAVDARGAVVREGEVHDLPVAEQDRRGEQLVSAAGGVVEVGRRLDGQVVRELAEEVFGRRELFDRTVRELAVRDLGDRLVVERAEAGRTSHGLDSDSVVPEGAVISVRAVELRRGDVGVFDHLRLSDQPVGRDVLGRALNRLLLARLEHRDDGGDQEEGHDDRDDQRLVVRALARVVFHVHSRSLCAGFRRIANDVYYIRICNKYNNRR